GYWKGGNVELTCDRYDIPFVKSFAENVHVDKKKPKKKAQLEAEKEHLQRQIDALQEQLAESKVT
ncbi:hypothetical protein COCC4DRAFT_45895, partial [Bipolaris maydis ATCC 48331]